MSVDDSMIEEFKIEAAEMLESAENGLLNLDKGLEFDVNYNSIFRSFHSVKGAAGMFGLQELQAHMHKLESLFEAQKTVKCLKKHQVDYFLKGIDAAKNLIDGKSVTFNHIEIENFSDAISNSSTPTPKIEVERKINAKLDRKSGVIFIIDDEPQIVDTLYDILSNNNFVLYKFYNGEDALKDMEAIAPDLVLSDIKMPKLSGVELIQKINEVLPHTIVIFISGYLSKEVMQEALSYGAEAFIEKPFVNASVLNICKTSLKRTLAMKLLEKSVNLILYQFSDLDEYLKSTGKESLRVNLKETLQVILEQKKILKNL